MKRLILLLLAGSLVLMADYQSAMRAFKAGDYGYALTQFVPEAESGNAAARNALGFMYERGLGVSKDAATAAEWYRKAAEQGYGPGQYNYGLCFWHGVGVAQSDAEAVKWMQQAARQGVYEAEYDLGNFYFKDGKGDIAQARAWWRRAAEHHIAGAAYNLAYALADAHDFTDAARWYRVAATQNYPLAQYALALLLESGQGVKADPVEARMWLELAARGGVAEAKAELESPAQKLSESELAEAKQRVSAWKPVKAPEPAEATLRTTELRAKPVFDPGPQAYQPQRVATGFFVNTEGGVLTSLDAVRGCGQLTVRTTQWQKRAELAGEDAALGLAVLAIEGGGGTPLALAADAPQERSLVEAGFQFAEHHATSISVTGHIAAAEGTRSAFQPDRPVDPPIAASPLVNDQATVLAVSMGKSLILGDDLLRFLRSKNVPLDGRPAPSPDLAQAAAAAKKSLVLVECAAPH